MDLDSDHRYSNMGHLGGHSAEPRRLPDEMRRKMKAQVLFDQRERELDEALATKENPSIETQLEYYKNKAKRDSMARYEAELELARVQRKSRRHRENIRGMQRALRVAVLERQVAEHLCQSMTSARRAAEQEPLAQLG